MDDATYHRQQARFHVFQPVFPSHFQAQAAMRRGNRISTADKTSHDQFRTPDKAPQTGRSAKSTSSKRAFGSSRKKSGSPVSSGSTSKLLRRNSTLASSAGDQPTLTQIDFVTTQGPSDDELDYIEGEDGRDGTKQNNDVIEIDDDSEDDTNYKPSTRRARGVRFDKDAKSNVPKRKKSTSKKWESIEKPARRRSSSKINKTKDKKADKTLTQMKFVMPFLKIDSDEDDANLEYTTLTPKKEDRKPDTENDEKTLSRSKKRKLEDMGSNGETKLASVPGHKPSRDPATPNKPRKHEIPSSQSPESPGFAVISSSQFRGATRSPRKLKSPVLPSRYVKEESPESGIQQPNLQHKDRLNSPLPPSSPIFDPPVSHQLVFVGKGASNLSYPSSNSRKGPSTVQHANKPERPISTQDRTVVYETDAESDEDFQDDLPSAPTSPKRQERNGGQHHTEDADDSINDDSPDLPPPNLASEQDMEADPSHLQTNLSSDASIYYQRLQPATQFPLEPIPNLNTQKMGELFPQDSSTQNMPDPARLESSPGHRTMPAPCLQSQTQTQTQTQSQSRDLGEKPTETVPESSPVTRQADGSNIDESIPPDHSRQSVVQVESSQPVDRFCKQHSGPRGILTESQLLTSSVMESIPIPHFWMGSQESVGEPYSQPDGESNFVVRNRL